MGRIVRKIIRNSIWFISRWMMVTGICVDEQSKQLIGPWVCTLQGDSTGWDSKERDAQFLSIMVYMVSIAAKAWDCAGSSELKLPNKDLYPIP